MFKLIVLLATVAYASAGLYSGYGGNYGYGGYGYGGYGLGHGVAAIAPAVTYAAHAPIATSYANTYKVAVAPAVTKLVAPAYTKVAYAPTVTKLAYSAPAITYPVSYNHYGYTIPHSVNTYSNLGYGYGHGYGLGYGYGINHGYDGYGGYGGYGGHGGYYH